MTERGAATRFYHEVALPYEGDDCLIWPFSRDRQGYGHFATNGKPRKAHRLVCEAHCGPPPTSSHVAAHRCGKIAAQFDVDVTTISSIHRGVKWGWLATQ